ncbi:putative mitochondrial protein, partial [Tanacetum coccineum]
ASCIGLGAVLQQNDHPIAYLSKFLAPKHQLLSTYEKEYLAVLLALEKWRGYLLDIHFVIKTDHYSLKYLLDQRITTPAQMNWLPKLMGYDYEVVYKQGKDKMHYLEQKMERQEALCVCQLLRKGKLVVGSDEALWKDLFSSYHDGAIGGRK